MNFGSLFSLQHRNSERFKPYSTSSPNRLKSILHKSEWNNYQQKQQLKPLPTLGYLSIQDKMERLKKLIGFTSKDKKQTSGFGNLNFDTPKNTNPEAEQRNRAFSLTGIVRAALPSSSLFSTPKNNNDNNFYHSIDSEFRARNNTVSNSEQIIKQKEEKSSLPDLNKSQQIRQNNEVVQHRRSISSPLPNTTKQWRHQKYIDEKEERMMTVKRLEAELSDRERSRHNRKIKEHEMRRVLLQLEGLVLERRELPRDEFAELPHAARQIIQIVWDKSAPLNEVLSNFDGADITRKDLLKLRGLEWLNDEVINFYINLIVDRSRIDRSLPRVYAFNTFFFENYSTKGYAGVKRWTRKVDIFDHQILIVPIHLGNHWCMAIIDVERRKIDYYDSLMGDNPECIEALKRYLMEESMDKKKRPLDMTGWECTTRKDIPTQQNLSDCGMFSCLFAEYASRRAPITFNQKHIPYFRERFVYEILRREML